ncbi:hypothetical protein N7449_001894 [Penicillium cf. viridicatum]|uniref:Uncharacterized protein n=1 Tax=Penicillium cf. viridicatum TaxID=2972119 RepID=A0A9W9N7L4_9EURO|nr:hypothetical protein N7449_001894 [Penicillium cf. viridicatum]
MVDEEYQSADDQSVSSTESGETHDERMATRENYEQEQEKQEALQIYTREKFLAWLNSDAPICIDKVKETFNRLIQEASSSESYFYFFINNLDEFEGDEVDHWRLSQDLKSWTAQAENVKLCVSSRPRIPFVQSFANDLNHQISIHELTRGDIFNFSVAMFEKDPNFHRVKDIYKDLVTEVVEAFDGMRPYTETELNERFERASSMKETATISYEVQFLHRSARDYIVNTREVQMRSCLPDFDVYSGISRLLLAEFKFARFTLHDIRPRVWGHLGEKVEL